MHRALVVLLVTAIVVAVAWFLAGLPGTVTATVGRATFQASLSVVAVALLATFVALHALARLAGALIRLPRTIRTRRANNRRQAGEIATIRALVALAASEPADARREAARARRLLGETPQTLLLCAEAGRIAGRPDETEEAFQALTGRPEAAFLGYRGLLRDAEERQDWTEAAALAGKAEEAHPGAAWLREERARLAIRTGAWSDALALANADAPKAALATAAAEAEVNPAQALRLARLAWKEDATLAPAALAYARRLRASGREGRAQAVIRRAWATPHPDLAEFALASVTDKLARYQAAQRLTRINVDHPESRYLLARTAFEAGLLGEARRHAEAAQAAGLNEKRLWLLRAAIEAEDHGDTEAGRLAQRDALRHAAAADPDAGWYCTVCREPQGRWQPACPSCGTAGSLRWGRPASIHAPRLTAETLEATTQGSHTSDAMRNASVSST
jgi:HemY protein